MIKINLQNKETAEVEIKGEAVELVAEICVVMQQLKESGMPLENFSSMFTSFILTTLNKEERKIFLEQIKFLINSVK